MTRPSNIALFAAYLCAVKEAGEVPSGHLYAIAMEAGVGLAQHLHVLSVLRSSNMVVESNYLLSITDHGRSTAEKLEAIV